jgi:hypothetical protein
MGCLIAYVPATGPQGWCLGPLGTYLTLYTPSYSATINGSSHRPIPSQEFDLTMISQRGHG